MMICSMVLDIMNMGWGRKMSNLSRVGLTRLKNSKFMPKSGKVQKMSKFVQWTTSLRNPMIGYIAKSM